MHQRRKETAPTLLFAVAATAVGISCAITIGLPAPADPERIDAPRRASGPIVWRVETLAPLVAQEPAVANTDPVLTSLVAEPFALRAPRLTPAPAALANEQANRLALGPYKLHPRVTRPAEMVVWLPAAPRWRSGSAAPYTITSRMRRAWSIGPIDTLAALQAAGRAGVEAKSQVRRFSALVANDRTLRSPDLAPTPQLAAARVASPHPTRVVSLAPAARPSITEYIASSSRSGHFPTPGVLAEQLDRVAETPEHAAWAWAVAYRLRTLVAATTDQLDAHRSLATLADAATEALALAEKSTDAANATELRRASYALTRRVTTWRAEQSRWLAMRMEPATPVDRLKAARWAMAMPAYGMGPGALIAESPRAKTVLRVARRVEAYEQRPTSRLASLLAQDAANLAATEGAEGRALASAINQNYRNANVRVAIADELLERLVPEPEPVVSMIRDRIAGSPVTGRSTTESELQVRLTEDNSAWRIGLEAVGAVTARTRSRGGPAVLSSVGSTAFTAKKLVVITPDGLKAAPTVADARTQSQRLVGLATSYDRVPLLGNYVRSTARSEYSRLSGRAKAETRFKVERQVSRTMDERIDSQLGKIEQRFAENVTARAASLGMRIDPIEMRTTDKRLITRVRVAGEDQLGAHTPRMRAPSDSLLSVQLHESMLNNALEGLDLAGQTITTDELSQRLADKLGLPRREAGRGEVATLRFATDEPIRLTLTEGRAKLTLAFSELSVRGRRHRNFRVHAFYRPEVNGLTASLKQDGTPHIEGRLRTGARIHLHGVMGKVLGENERLPLVRIDDRTPPMYAAALKGLATNQFVIEDGWLGLAIGPPRKADQVAVRVGTYVR